MALQDNPDYQPDYRRKHEWPDGRTITQGNGSAAATNPALRVSTSTRWPLSACWRLD
jgi:hypothetical protein